MGLIDEILHHVVQVYREDENPEVWKKAATWLGKKLTDAELETAIKIFSTEFPPSAVYRGETELDTYLDGATNDLAHREVALEELVMLWLANANPAFSPYNELFDDTLLVQKTVYKKITTELRAFFDTQPTFGPDNSNLIDLLRAPALNNPDSLFDQLAYIRQNWYGLLERIGGFYLRLLRGLDILSEEGKWFFKGDGFVKGDVQPPSFYGLEEEIERFSPDSDWMPSLVLLAKNAYVWLDQLSKKYKRKIRTLDQVPDAELDLLASWGFTGLWLIGLWERSPASQRIKHLCGNPDAVASAYSLYDSIIAHALGGEQAYNNLRDRAWQRGIRMAADMVPNHTGIYSKWVIEHPEWYLHLDYSPFPTYTFNGPNLSEHPDVGIYLEDHYYSRSDAAVVFKRVDFHNGRTHFIYHGNDGTSMPWNDTAQINYLNQEAREAVIQTILQVARMFPIIRFDAAMTLAKRHIQRLWFPEPGTGGAIASRAEHGMPKMRFDELMPNEFWAEVVDRVAHEVPNTLLLAEAFWMMEGYFVRTLGMHRVYNSAFMNMMRDEKNAEYRVVIKDTIEFDPEILKRYVNFMNNPDEETAIEQFGDGGKYFGVAILMATMPGLPMFGHGQVEGYHEKYGMEYYRAYWDEHPNKELIRRHEREVFPIFKKRYLFANVDHFYLYDFFTDHGVNEDVFVYSNMAGHERGLVLYHNKWAETSGRIKTSAAFSVKTGEDSRELVQRNLAEGLALPNDSDHYVIFRDHIEGMEYIRNCVDVHENGLYFHLGGYQYRVYIDFRVVKDVDGTYAALNDFLNGAGTPDVADAAEELALRPVLQPYRELVNPGMFRWMADNALTDVGQTLSEDVATQTRDKIHALVYGIRDFVELQDDPYFLAEEITRDVLETLRITAMGEEFPLPNSRKYVAAQEMLANVLEKENGLGWAVFLTWAVVRRLGEIAGEKNADIRTLEWYKDFLFSKATKQIFVAMGASDDDARSFDMLIRLTLEQKTGWYLLEVGKRRRALKTAQSWYANIDLQKFLGINKWQGVVWYNNVNFRHLYAWGFLMDAFALIQEQKPGTDGVADGIVDLYEVARELEAGEEVAGYHANALLRAIEP
jgi:glycosidase